MIRKLLLVLTTACLTSCTSPDGEVQTRDVKGNWKPQQALVFDFQIKDPGTPKNIIFVVRNNEEYPYSNIRFFVEHDAGDAKTAKIDTVNFILAKPSGEWLGKGLGATKEIEFLYKSAFRFPKAGPYHFRVRQAMRNNDLPGIEDISIKIAN